MPSTPTPSRLSVPLTPEVHATFQRLAKAMGGSLSSAIAEWLVDTQEAADMMAKKIIELRRSPNEFVTKVRLHTEAVEDAAEAALEAAMRDAEGDDRRALARDARGGRQHLTPPSSNTGGKVRAGSSKPGAPGMSFPKKCAQCGAPWSINHKCKAAR